MTNLWLGFDPWPRTYFLWPLYAGLTQIASPTGIWASQPSLPGPSPSGQSTGFDWNCYRIWAGPGRAHTKGWSWAIPGGARLGIDRASPCPDESHSAQGCPDKSRLDQSGLAIWVIAHCTITAQCRSILIKIAALINTNQNWLLPINADQFISIPLNARILIGIGHWSSESCGCNIWISTCRHGTYPYILFLRKCNTMIIYLSWWL